VLVRTDIRAINSIPIVIDFDVQRLEDGGEMPGQRPAAKPTIDCLPDATAFRQITPRDTGADLPKHRAEEFSIADLWRPPPTAVQQGLEYPPLFVT